MTSINYPEDDSLLLPTADVTSPAAGAGKDALDSLKLAEVAEKLAQANLEQETKTLADIERALRLRNALVRAIMEKRTHSCDLCMEPLEKLTVNRRILMETGIGFVLLDSSAWSDKFRPRITALKSKWLSAVVGQRTAMDGTRVIKLLTNQKPFSGKSQKYFMIKCDVMATWMSNSDEEMVSWDTYQAAAYRCVLFGFDKWEGLDGVLPEDVALMVSDPAVRTALTRLARKATVIAGALRLQQDERFRRQAIFEAQTSRKRSITDADVVAAELLAQPTITAESIDIPFKGLARNRGKTAVTPLDMKPRPRQLLSELMIAGCGDGEKVQECLDQRAKQLKLANIAKSKPATISGLKLWTNFAEQVLGYPRGCAIPPSEADHVVKYIGVFTNPGTAQNYISNLRFACTYAGKDNKHWDTEEVRMTLRGLKKIDFKLYKGPKRVKFLLTELHIRALYTYNKTRGWMVWAVCILMSWCFLLRAQSESLTVFKGTSGDDIARPADRQNGLYFEDKEQKVLCFWMKSRKNRPGGSLLRFKCSCQRSPDMVCPCCDTREYLGRFQVGEEMWSFKPHVFLREVKKSLEMLGIAKASNLTFKSFRAGMATHMARSGLFHVKEITEAGEWKSDCWNRYVDEDQVLDAVLNPCESMDRVLAQSDSEAEEDAKDI